MITLFSKKSYSKDFCCGTSLFLSLFVSLLVSSRARASTYTWNVLEHVLERFLVGNYYHMIIATRQQSLSNDLFSVRIPT